MVGKPFGFFSHLQISQRGCSTSGLSAAGVMASCDGLMVRVTLSGGALRDGYALSETVTDTLEAPSFNGVPAIVTELLGLAEGMAVRPFGKPVTFQEYGPTPPLTVNVAVYAAPTLPEDNEPEIDGAGLTVKLNVAETDKSAFEVAVRVTCAGDASELGAA